MNAEPVPIETSEWPSASSSRKPRRNSTAWPIRRVPPYGAWIPNPGPKWTGSEISNRTCGLRAITHHLRSRDISRGPPR